MSNVMPISSKSLASKASRINELYAGMANAYLETAAILASALEEDFNEDKKEFLEWATSKTLYSASHINTHLRVHERFGSHTGLLELENPIPIKVLEKLSGQDISSATVKRIIRMYQRKIEDLPTQREAIKLISGAMELPAPVEPEYNLPFEQRIPPEGYVVKAEKLLDVDAYASAETVRILARHWKNKYHPDKGGDARVFDLIVQAEKTLMKKRGEK